MIAQEMKDKDIILTDFQNLVQQKEHLMKEAKMKYTKYMQEVQKTGGTKSSTPSISPHNNSIIQGAYDVGAEEIQREILSSGYLTKKG